MKCVYTLFSKEGLISNIGNYIFLFIILFYFTSAILFHKCGYPLLENTMNDILEKRKEYNKKNCNRKETNGAKDEENNHKKNIKKISKKKKMKKNNSKSLSLLNIKNSNKSVDILKTKDEQINVIQFNDYELNSMDYKHALKYDN